MNGDGISIYFRAIPDGDGPERTLHISDIYVSTTRGSRASCLISANATAAITTSYGQLVVPAAALDSYSAALCYIDARAVAAPPVTLTVCLKSPLTSSPTVRSMVYICPASSEL